MQTGSEPCARGCRVAALVAGSWRSAPPLELSEADPADVLGPLLVSGAGGLAWRRLSQSSLRNSILARPLRRAYRAQTVQAVEHEQHLQRLFERMHGAGIQAILVKG